ncbi:hypothetical protein HYR54_12955 [Candidatus Acetothermia bacterium]|nr:hypothetical protein [Candidatus Acetothermia bacterium]
MSQTMKARWASGLILVGLAVGILGSFANAQELEPQRQPGDYLWLEFASGTVGALAGGFIAVYAVAGFVPNLYDPCENQLGYLTCGLGALRALLVVLVGDAVGGAVGVVMAGSFKHVRGNILLAFTGAIAGEAVGLAILHTGLIDPLLRANPVFIFPFYAFFVALGATYGFNIHATIELAVLSPTNQGLVLIGLKTQVGI